jgi:hypothetical protein
VKKLMYLPLAALAVAAGCDSSGHSSPFAPPDAPAYDLVEVSSSATLDITTKVMTLSLGGANGVTTAFIKPENGDGVAGCNLKSGELVVGVASSEALVATVTSSITFTSCDDEIPVSVTPVGIGTATVTFAQISNTTGGTFDFTKATFTVNVEGPSNSAPVLAAIGDKQVAEGSALTFTASATDSDAGQSLTFSLVDAPAGATINATTGVFSWTPDDGPASATFTVKVTDDGSPALSDEEEITVTVNNVAPTATPSFDTSVPEGTSFNLSLINPSDPSTADVAAGFEYAFDCGDGAGYSSFNSTNSRSCSTSNVGSPNVGAKIRDKDGDETLYTGTVSVTDISPQITSLSVSPALVALNEPATVTVVFSGYSGDLNTLRIFCDASSSTATHTVTADPGTVSRTCSYTAAGLYRVKVEVQDNDDVGTDDEETFQYVVVYDPSAGFVTGGGWITYAGAACPVLCGEVAGRGDFGFVARYQRGAQTPTGNTAFEFHAGSLKFASTSYEWLVVSGARAQFKGEGRINGAGSYDFLLTAVDGQVNGGGGVDRFRIKITNKLSGQVVFDNQWGDDDDGPVNTALDKVNGNGSIVIHSK